MRRRLYNGLVVWYGAFQLGHVALNGLYLAGDGPPPFPGPTGGWSDQALVFLDAFALFDLVNAAVAVVGVAGHLRHRRWARTALVVCLTISMYAACAFTYAIAVSGAWRAETSGTYVATWLPFLPVVALFPLSLRQAHSSP